MLRSRSFLAASFFALTTLGALAVAQTKPAGKAATGNVYQRSIKSVVWVFDPISSTNARTGSGTLIDLKDRIIVTNEHVVGDSAEVYVLFPIFDAKGALVNDRKAYIAQLNAGAIPKGRVLARDQKKDLAIIQLPAVPKDSPAIRLAKDSAGTADAIHCIGNSGVSGGLFDYCKGEVRNITPPLKRTALGGAKPVELFVKMIEHTAPVNKGQSGGPVFNDAGELVGVTQGHVPDEQARGISLAVELSEVKDFLKANKFARIATATAPAVVTAQDTPKIAPMPTELDPKAEAARKESAANSKLGFAKDLLADGKKEKAKQRLDDIIRDYPDTKAAAEAKTMLEKLR